eukprot:CAMPEP_0202910796 /NCGR_PEP_ID=MMETSP1392-20130828/53054_1 /ASSEMBLY_ACC=CAM_ASM_000868 /TAXON_ID=225041 /ORGANISM="Chlamydomonas chlamydogama, Strain SAG 11-48b" /LENGTH=35 /DNA_ID= /DNA_START= /DNA_END= /DNA_ORIENTATION=
MEGGLALTQAVVPGDLVPGGQMAASDDTVIPITPH